MKKTRNLCICTFCAIFVGIALGCSGGASGGGSEESAGEKLKGVTLNQGNISEILGDSWWKNRDDKGRTIITIPEGVVKIERAAFEDYLGLINQPSYVHLPKSVKEIEAYASPAVVFNYNDPTKIYFDVDSIETWCKIKFGENFFARTGENVHCIHVYLNVKGEPINDLEIPDGITEINDYAFSNMSFEKIIIPDSVKTIGKKAFQLGSSSDYAFDDVLGLDYIKMGKGVSLIKEGAFGFRYLKDKYTFNDSSYYSFHTMDIGSLESWCNITFEHDDSGAGWLENENPVSRAGFLTSNDVTIGGKGTNSELRIPDGVKAINKYAFYKSCVESVFIPGSVKKIDEDAFSSCKCLNKVEIKEGVEVIEEGAFYQWIQDEGKKIESVHIPSSVNFIGKYAFYEKCKLDFADKDGWYMTEDREAVNGEPMTSETEYKSNMYLKKY